MSTRRIVIVGAGAGGLAAAVELAAAGCAVTVVERASTPGGKMRRVSVAGHEIDAGPTVFTMRWIFDALFANAGTTLEDHLTLTPASLLARHAWQAGGTLDLFADIEQSADAIGQFAGAKEAAGYRAFCARSQDIYQTLVQPFIAMEKPTSPLDLTLRAGFGNVGALWRTAPLKTLWTAISENFEDRRLRQLFGRYATYVGSSPWLAPATLMLIAHVEQAGVWLVDGGMHAVARAMQRVAEGAGASFLFGVEVRRIETTGGMVSAVILDNGERIAADAVIFNGDQSALAGSRLTEGRDTGLTATPQEKRSLSAITWCVHARTHGFPLAFHNVFFADDYNDEFRAIFERRTITQDPTVYICAQDRRADATFDPDLAEERLLLLVNAPADGDRVSLNDDAREDIRQRAFALLSRCGLEIDGDAGSRAITTPEEFNALFPATGGALYGRANHGTNATFDRAGTTTKVPGLYLAGGSVHPGAGVPMATMSGRLAAARVLADLDQPTGARRRKPIKLPADPG